MDLYKKWKDLCHSAGVDNSTDSDVKINYWYEYLIKSYSEPNRYYHNLRHIESMLSEVNDYYGDGLFHKAGMVMIFAIWFHDVVYDPTRKDNEEKSAEKLKECLEDLNIFGRKDSLFSNFGKKMVIATKHDKDESILWHQLICDLDLSILHSSWEDYKIYAENIRKEYAVFSDKDWTYGRLKFLEGMLSRDKSIFYGQKDKEIIAVANIKREIELLNENRSLQSNVSREPCSVS